MEKTEKKADAQVLLRVERLSQHFKLNKKKTLKAVDCLNFEIKKGEAFGLVGESGSGKTTTGRAIIGLYEVSEGKIWFKDKLIASGEKADAAEVKKNARERRRIQMIFQDPVASLNPRMTVREIIAEGLKVNGEKNTSIIDEKVYRYLRLVGLLPEHAGRYPHEFSGGQRQRIGIARALIMNPEMVIADEPVSALDVSIQAQVINLLNDLKRELGLTALFIAHDLSVVRYFCDRIAVMNCGKIVELAVADELFKNPLHAYTQSLLSAIPEPDPIAERGRTRISYQPVDYQKTGETPSLQEIRKEHFVYCTPKEAEQYREKFKKKRKGQ